MRKILEEQSERAMVLSTSIEIDQIGNHREDSHFVALLKRYSTRNDQSSIFRLHVDIIRRGSLQRSFCLGNALISAYAKAGALAIARRLHNEIPVRDTVSWNALIAGYADYGQWVEAFNCFERMKREGFFPNVITFSCLLKACTVVKAIDKGKEIHDEVVRRCLLEENVMLGTALVDMYAKCGNITKAHQVHDMLPLRNVISWSALISGYAQDERGHEALDCLAQMQNEGLSPNEITFVSILKACGNIKDIEKGEEIHEKMLASGLLQKNVMLGTALINMYAKCHTLPKAQQVLEELYIRDIVSWNALISGYSQGNQSYEALSCFERMKYEGLSPDEVTFTCILKACAITGAVNKGKRIHLEIISRALLEKNGMLGTALVDMYAKCGMLSRAQKLHDQLSIHTVGSWNALITGYVEQSQNHEALKCFECMQKDGFCPDSITFLCVLKACGNIGFIDKGKEIHDQIINKGLLENNISVGTALLDMYAKCGLPAKAQELHNELNVRNVVSWSALIAGYAQQGKTHEAQRCLEQMQREGLAPNTVTFLCVLSACIHAGLLAEAEMVFRTMNKEYRLTPSLEHHICMIMAWGSSGDFAKAVSVIDSMPSCDHPVVWLTLLAACKKWGNMKLGRLAFDQAVQLDCSCTLCPYG